MSLYGGAVKRPIMTTLCFVTVVILGIFSLAKSTFIQTSTPTR